MAYRFLIRPNLHMPYTIENNSAIWEPDIDKI